jgi:hypothetical protein
MAETSWDESTDLRALLRRARPALGERKKRLLVVAYARRIEHLLADHRSRQALDAAAGHADGLVDAPALKAARAGAQDAAREAEQAQQVARAHYQAVCRAVGWDDLGPLRAINDGTDTTDPAILAALTAYLDACTAAEAATTASRAIDGSTSPATITYHVDLALTVSLRTPASGLPQARAAAVREAENAERCRLLREVVGDPERRVAVADAWLAWQGGLVPRLAHEIYEERAFDRLPVLADALEDAGCADEALLGHLRAPGPHVQGCWALDLVREGTPGPW